MDQTHLQIRLITKQNITAVSDAPLTVPVTIECEALNQIVNELLKNVDSEFKARQFDFLAAGELLRVPLIEHLQERNIPFESTVDIEYIERFPAPEPQDPILHDDWVSAIHTNDSWILSACYDNSVNIWSKHGKHTAQLKDHTAVIKSVSWLQDGDPSKGFVSVSRDLKGIIWSWETGSSTAKPVAYLRGHEKSIESLGVSPNSQRLATGGWDTYLKIWSTSLEPENEERVRKKHKGDGSTILTKTPMNTLMGHKDSISSITWTSNSVICTASMDHTIKLWDAELCGIKSEIIGQKAFLDVAWSPLSNTFITGCCDRHVRLYDPRSTEGSVCKATFTSHKLWVSSVCWSKTDEHIFASAGYDSLVKVWDTRSYNTPLYDLQGHEDKVFCVDYTDKWIVSGGADNRIHIFKNKNK